MEKISLKKPEKKQEEETIRCTIKLSHSVISFDLKIPGFEGSIPLSRQNEQYLSEAVIKALRVPFGNKVEKA